MNIDITIDFHNVKLKKIKERTWCWKGEKKSCLVLYILVAAALRNMSGINT